MNYKKLRYYYNKILLIILWIVLLKILVIILLIIQLKIILITLIMLLKILKRYYFYYYVNDGDDYYYSYSNFHSVVSQNIIKKVSGQKFVYKFVSQPDPSLPDGIRNGDEGQRRDNTDPNSQSKGLGGMPSTCPSKGLPQVNFCRIWTH